MIRGPPRSPPFPYTPLSRSHRGGAGGHRHAAPAGADDDRVPGDRGTAVAGTGPGDHGLADARPGGDPEDRKSTRLNSSHANISYAVFCLKKKKNITHISRR